MPKEFGELPQNFGVVVADDEPYWLAQTGAAWDAAIRERGVEGGVSLVNGCQDLLEKVLLGVKPAVVVLDHKYEQNYRLWKPTEAMVGDIAVRLGVDFGPIKKPDRGGWNMSGVMPDDLYYPNSVNFGLLLRYLGFTGKIAVVSNDPPEPDYILRELGDLNEHLQNFGVSVNSPIDAVMGKPSRHFPNDFDYATRIKDDSIFGGKRWDWQRVKAENFSVAVGQLLEELV